MNARLALAALLLLAATAFASAAGRDGGSISIGAGAKVAASKCLFSLDWDCVQQEQAERIADETYMAAACESLWGEGTVCAVPDGRGAIATIAAGFTADWTDAQLERAMASAVKSGNE